MTKRSRLENFRAATAAVPRSSVPAADTAASASSEEAFATPPPVEATPVPPARPLTPRADDRAERHLDSDSDNQPDSGRRPARERARHDRAPRDRRVFPRQAAAWFVGAAVLVLLALVAMTSFTSFVHPTTNWLALAGSVVGLTLAGWGLVHYLRPTVALAGYTALGVILILSVFTYGLANSVVINGKVYWANSQTARAYTLSSQLNSAISTIQNYDVLLTYSTPQARAHFNTYSTAIAKVSQIFSYWSTYPHSNLPDAGFVDVINNLAAAANADAVVTSTGPTGALADKLTYINNSAADPTLASTVVSERASVIASLQAAQVDLNAIATKYNFPSASGVHE